ncbi:hypothetical protein VTL71DRAFT_9173 [Oculimacula yallundae]|uniref:P-loop containing nucleoside triphosphate hydrolase protein n=1 Tax=Oculimacula yallundae TaxID=86028 RepID=A0ABR4BS94_9HELO
MDPKLNSSTSNQDLSSNYNPPKIPISSIRNGNAEIATSQQKRHWYHSIFRTKRRQDVPSPVERGISPEYRASLWSKLTFQWVGDLILLGYRRRVELVDLWLVNPNRLVEHMASRLQSSFADRVANGKKRPLAGALYQTFKRDLGVSGISQLVSNLLMILTPFTLRFLIQFATDTSEANRNGTPPPHTGKGIGLVATITVMSILQSLGNNQFTYHGKMVGGQARAALIACIYEKSLKISGRGRAGGTRTGLKFDVKNSLEVETEKHASSGTSWADGKVFSLISVHAQRVDQAAELVHTLWIAPAASVLSIILLIVNLGYSALAGLAVMIFGMFALVVMVKSLSQRRVLVNNIVDQRVSLTQEILQSMRFVKYFAWENAFLARMDEIRQKENGFLRTLLMIKDAVFTMAIALPVFASIVAFITFSLTGHELVVAKIFSTFALFNSLRIPLNMLPVAAGQSIEAWVSIGVIQEYLLAEEMESGKAVEPDSNYAVRVQNADFTWEVNIMADGERAQSSTQSIPATSSSVGQEEGIELSVISPVETAKPPEVSPTTGQSFCASSVTIKATSPFILKEIDLSIFRHELVAVIGGVGSGKSSLLAALANEMRRTAGDVTLGGSLAFCPQNAWVQNTSVQNNILFGKEMKPEWYQEVVGACALQADLDQLPRGDSTEVGERGITLSGGQKQRLNLARAIYSNADIILMDDPLNSVDAHVGKHIFNEAICRLLRHKCCILATHQLHVLVKCDRVVWMQDGTILANDSFDNLMATNKLFASMMADETNKGGKAPVMYSKEVRVEDTHPASVRIPQDPSQADSLMQEEEITANAIPWGLYVFYVRLGGSLFFVLLVTGTLLVLAQGILIATSLWLSYWTANTFQFSTDLYIGVYASLGVAQAVMMFFFSLSLTIYATRASNALLKQALTRISYAPISLFDTTPLGRMMNRFSKDIDAVDSQLSEAIRMLLLITSTIGSVFILISVYYPYFVLVLVPLVLIFAFLFSYQQASAGEIKSHEAVLRSVVFAKFTEGVSGTACIRAYKAQRQFIHTLRAAIDNMNSAYYLTFAYQCWLAARLDMIGNTVIFTTGMLVVAARFSISPSTAGLVLSYVLAIVQMFQLSARLLADVSNAMNSTERLHHYATAIEQEKTTSTVAVPDSWPLQGEIVFSAVDMRYRPNLPPVLKDMDMRVTPGEHIGIVGRTGAGKSSIINVIFRLNEISRGSISIDGLDIANLNLRTLRSRLSIIPQDPTLFRGTIRSNLDLFSEHSDLILWTALRKSNLVAIPAGDVTKQSSLHLDSVVEERGLNFSLGQRQLIALARALVRGSRIILCDEATSSVDLKTDQIIQKTMQEAFRGKTLLCIAHRLRTIIGYDRICLMEQGRIAELGTPLILFDQGQRFRAMCDESEITREDILSAMDNR